MQERHLTLSLFMGLAVSEAAGVAARGLAEPWIRLRCSRGEILPGDHLSLDGLSLGWIVCGLSIIVCGRGVGLLLVEKKLVWVVTNAATRRHVRLLLRR